MKKFAVFALILFLFGIAPFVKFNKNSNSANAMCKIEDARSGCCSHHGGVCGCSNGRARCCDGSLSPSCGCY